VVLRLTLQSRRGDEYMKAAALTLAVSFFIAGCGGPPAADSPEAMGRHFVSLLDSGDIEKAVAYAADNWWENGPLKQKTRQKLVKELSEFIRSDRVTKYTFSELETEEGTRATGWFRKRREDGTGGEEIFRMTRQDGRWWFCK
jgi:hypothetical protein